MAGEPIRWAVVIAAAGAACVSQAFGRFTYSLLFTDIRDDLGISNTVGGAIGSVNLVAYLVGSLVVSVVVGRLGLIRCLRLGTVAATAALAVLAWGPNAAVVAAGSATAGFFGAFVWITAPGVATVGLGPGRRGLVVGVIGGGIGVGIVIAALLRSAAAPLDWRATFRVEAAISLVLTALVLVAVRAGPRLAGRPIGAREGVAALRGVPGWRGLLIAYGLFALALSLVMTFTVAVLETDAGWPPTGAGMAFTALGAGTVVGGPLFGSASDRFGRAPAAVVAFAVIVLTGLVLPLGAQPWSVVVAAAFGAAFTGIPTIIAARINDHLGGERFGAAFGIATLAFGAGLVCGPQLGGALADVTGSFRPAFAIVTVAAVAGLVLSARQPEG